MVTASTIPYTEVVKSKKGFTSECKFCDFTTTMKDAHMAMQEVTRHARTRHYSWTTGLFQDDKEKARQEARVREHQRILGEKEQVDDMNRMGL